jgi:hypothetical protein
MHQAEGAARQSRFEGATELNWAGRPRSRKPADLISQLSDDDQATSQRMRDAVGAGWEGMVGDMKAL